MKEYNLEVIDENNEIKSCVLYVSKLDNKDYHFQLKIDNENYESTSTFQFRALCEIRLELESVNLRLMCKGSKMNVYPSGGLLRSNKAYTLTMGRSPELNEVVNIYDIEKNIEEISTVEEQKKYYNKWLISLTNNN